MSDVADSLALAAWLYDKTAPHEPPAILRFFRAGIRGAALLKVTNAQPREAIDLLQIALTDEVVAHAQGRPIHDAVIYACAKCGGAMDKAASGTGYRCPADNHWFTPKKE